MNDWIPISEACPDGTQCQLRFRDCLGAYDVPGPYFFHDDGNWYLIDPPRLIEKKPTHFKPI